jgi:hypothetical protein
LEGRRGHRPGQPGLFLAIQPASGPAPGYFVSTTSAVADPKLPAWDQRRYVSATDIPYAALAWWWPKLKVHKGDFGLAIRPDTGSVSGFVFADAGTAKVGEVSNKLMETCRPESGVVSATSIRHCFWSRVRAAVSPSGSSTGPTRRCSIAFRSIFAG